MLSYKKYCKVGKNTTSLILRLTNFFNLLDICKGDDVLVSIKEIDGKSVIVIEK